MRGVKIGTCTGDVGNPNNGAVRDGAACGAELPTSTLATDGAEQPTSILAVDWSSDVFLQAAKDEVIFFCGELLSCAATCKEFPDDVIEFVRVRWCSVDLDSNSPSDELALLP